MLERHVPKHRLCNTCTVCDQKFIMGVEGATTIVQDGETKLTHLTCYAECDPGHYPMQKQGLYYGSTA
jgi:hypothetical protein